MKLEKKFTEFIKNKIDFILAKDYTYGNYGGEYDGEYQFCPNQYEIKNKIVKWFVELEFDIKATDEFYVSLLDMFRKGQKIDNSNEFITIEIKKLIGEKKLTDKEIGTIFKFAWYFHDGRAFSNSYLFNGKDRNCDVNNPNSMKNIGKILLPYIPNYSELKEKIELFRDKILNKYDKEMKMWEKEKRNSFANEIMTLKYQIENSTLNNDFKDELLESLHDYHENKEMIIHLDNCMYFLEKEGFKTWDLSSVDETKLANYLSKYISENIPNFPVNITTEDYVIIYEPNKKYNFTQNDLPIKWISNKTKKWYVKFSYLSKTKNGRRTFDTALIGCDVYGYSLEKCEEIKKFIENKDFKEFKFDYYFGENELDRLIKTINDDDFELDCDGIEIKELSGHYLDDCIERE